MVTRKGEKKELTARPHRVATERLPAIQARNRFVAPGEPVKGGFAPSPPLGAELVTGSGAGKRTTHQGAARQRPSVGKEGAV